MSLKLKAASLLVLGFSGQAMAAGFEKTINWSGRWQGVAGAATAASTGAEALYFNPAGLATGAGNGEVTLNFSPTFSQFEGPFTNGVSGNENYEGESQFSPIYGALASYKLNDRLGLGLGFFLGGGARAKFDDVLDNARLDYSTDLAVNEASLGVGYKIMDGLTFGASYRVSLVSAEVIGGLPDTPAGGQTTRFALTDLADTNFAGFRAGLQYSQQSWGLGLSYRSKVKFAAEGNLEVDSTFAAVNGTGETTLSGELPQQLNVGVWLDAVASLRTYLEYSLTQYSAVRKIDIDASSESAGTNGVATSLSNADIKTNYMNAHVGRVGFEYTGVQDVALRLGYAITSQVTPKDRASLTLSPPGVGHSITLGAGFAVLDKKLGVNIAGAYDMAGGDGTSSTLFTGTEGEYKAASFQGHLGLTYSL